MQRSVMEVLGMEQDGSQGATTGWHRRKRYAKYVEERCQKRKKWADRQTHRRNKRVAGFALK